MTSNVRRGNSGFATVADRPSLASSRAHGVPKAAATVTIESSAM